jgi:hypothetical protein
MEKLVLFGIIALLLLSSVRGADVNGGDSVVVIGRGSEGNGSQPPVLRGSDNIDTTRDPGSYVVPGTPVPKPTPPKPPTPSSEDNFNETGAPTTVTFTMTSDVSGQGKFSTWKNLVGEEKSKTPKVHQRTSALSGNLADSSLTIYAMDKQASIDTSSDVRFIRSANKILFTGNSYSEFTRVTNGADQMVESYEAGAINKTSSYDSLFAEVIEEEPEGDFAYNRTIQSYLASQTSSRFVGKFNLHACINGTEIEENLIGRFAEERKMSGESHYNLTMQETGMDCVCS